MASPGLPWFAVIDIKYLSDWISIAAAKSIILYYKN